MLEAGRDLGAGPWQTFRRVTLPLSKPAILAGLVIVSLPMFGDYYTNDLLGSERTSMLGNLIDDAVSQSGRGPEAGSLTIVLMLIVVIPMIYYLRETRRAAEHGMSDAVLDRVAERGSSKAAPSRRLCATPGESRGGCGSSRSATWHGPSCRS